MYARLVVPDRGTSIYISFGDEHPADLKGMILKALTVAIRQWRADGRKLYFEMCPKAVAELVNSLPNWAGTFQWGISDDGRERRYYGTRVVEVPPPTVLNGDDCADNSIMAIIRAVACL